jgi:hypothetical protein
MRIGAVAAQAEMVRPHSVGTTSRAKRFTNWFGLRQ